MNDKNKDKDKEYMSRAIELAKRGAGWTSPNPLVGAVIVKDDRVIGEGWHHRYGDLHAERDALKNCSEDPAGAVIYVTLEPCCHHGKQPPCTEALIEAGIRKVVMGSGDPNPLVAGQGVNILREHGIEVIEGVLEEECHEINDVFFHYITTGMPFVAMKYAMTLDGKIACYTGESKWVTGEKSREHVQTLRNRYRGIMVGIGTVLADDPMLNCRMPGGRSPVRIICDSHLRTPLSAKVVQTAGEYETIIATCIKDPERLKPYQEMGVSFIQTNPGTPTPVLQNIAGAEGARGEMNRDTPPQVLQNTAGSKDAGAEMDRDTPTKVLQNTAGSKGAGAEIDRDTPTQVLQNTAGSKGAGAEMDQAKSEQSIRFSQKDKIDLRALLQQLGERKIDSILLEGGAQLNWSMLSGGFVNKVYTYIAPKLFGGAEAKSPIGGCGFPRPDAAVRLEKIRQIELGEDLLIESRPVK